MPKNVKNYKDVKITKVKNKNAIHINFRNCIESLFQSVNGHVMLLISPDNTRIYFGSIGEEYMRLGFKNGFYKISKPATAVNSAWINYVPNPDGALDEFIGEHELLYDDEIQRYYISVNQEPFSANAEYTKAVIANAEKELNEKLENDGFFTTDDANDAIFGQVLDDDKTTYVFSYDKINLLRKNIKYLGYNFDDLLVTDLEYETRKAAAYKTYLALKEEFNFD